MVKANKDTTLGQATMQKNNYLLEFVSTPNVTCHAYTTGQQTQKVCIRIHAYQCADNWQKAQQRAYTGAEPDRLTSRDIAPDTTITPKETYW